MPSIRKGLHSLSRKEWRRPERQAEG